MGPVDAGLGKTVAAGARHQRRGGGSVVERPAQTPKGEEYTDQGQTHYEKRYWQRVLHNLSRRAQQLGMPLVAVTPAPQMA